VWAADDLGKLDIGHVEQLATLLERGEELDLLLGDDVRPLARGEVGRQKGVVLGGVIVLDLDGDVRVLLVERVREKLELGRRRDAPRREGEGQGSVLGDAVAFGSAARTAGEGEGADRETGGD